MSRGGNILGLGLSPGATCYDPTRGSWIPYWFDTLTESSCMNANSPIQKAILDSIGLQTMATPSYAALPDTNAIRNATAPGPAVGYDLVTGTIAPGSPVTTGPASTSYSAAIAAAMAAASSNQPEPPPDPSQFTLGSIPAWVWVVVAAGVFLVVKR